MRSPMETGSLGALDARLTQAPRCPPIRFCPSCPLLQSHTEHENFLRNSPLYACNGPDYFLKDNESISAEQNNASCGETDLKKKKLSALRNQPFFSPMNKLGSCKFFEWFICTFLLFCTQNCNNTETNNCCLKNFLYFLTRIDFYFQTYWIGYSRIVGP